MNAEDTIRDILVKAAKQLETDWYAAYDGRAPEDWHLQSRERIDQAVDRARALMARHAEELGKMAGLFEKCRIQKLYKDLDSAIYTVKFAREAENEPELEPTPEMLAEERVDQLRTEIYSRQHEIDRQLSPAELEASLTVFHRWARTRIEASRVEFRQSGVEPQSYIFELLRDIEVSLSHTIPRLLKDKKEGWLDPPTFEFISADDLKDIKGLYLDYYPDGQLRSVHKTYESGGFGVLQLAQGRPTARYEDAGNVAEFRDDGVIEEYGGRYDHETLARMSFKEWVLGQIRQMAGA